MRFRQKGIAHLGLILVVIVLVGVGATGWFVLKKNKKTEPTPTQSTVKQETEQTEAKPAAAKPFQREAVVLTNDRFTNAEVIKIADNQYRMFWHQVNRIMSAVSADGKTFSVEDGARLTGEMPATVKLADGRWRMYYKDSSGIKSAISSDGFSFLPEAGTRLTRGGSGAADSGSLIHPSVVALPDGSFRMYYDGVNTTGNEQGPMNWSIMSAHSSDGLTWQKDESVRIDVHSKELAVGETILDSAFSAHVDFKDGKYYMYFTAETDPGELSGIWLAISTNGVDFAIEPEPVLARDPKLGEGENQDTNSGPKGVPQDPFVLSVPGGDRLFYWVVNEGYLSAFRPN